MTRRLCFGLAAVALIAATACTGDDTCTGPEASDGIRLASFDFAESVLLAEMYAQVIESTGVPVVRLGAIGPREIIAPAMQNDLIDVVPEYLGTALQFAGAPEPESDSAVALNELNSRLAERGLIALEAASAEDKNVFVVTEELAAQQDLESISDLAPLANGQRFGGPPECAARALCLAGLERVYGLQFAEFVPQRSLTFTAEALRRQEIEVGLMFSTAAELVAFDLFVLVDDQQMQPAENIVPVARADALDRWGPDVTDALGDLVARLTTRELRILNVQVANEEPVEDVTREWLTVQRLLG